MSSNGVSASLNTLQVSIELSPWNLVHESLHLGFVLALAVPHGSDVDTSCLTEYNTLLALSLESLSF